MTEQDSGGYVYPMYINEYETGSCVAEVFWLSLSYIQ